MEGSLPFVSTINPRARHVFVRGQDADADLAIGRSRQQTGTGRLEEGVKTVSRASGSRKGHALKAMKRSDTTVSEECHLGFNHAC